METPRLTLSDHHGYRDGKELMACVDKLNALLSPVSPWQLATVRSDDHDLFSDPLRIGDEYFRSDPPLNARNSQRLSLRSMDTVCEILFSHGLLGDIAEQAQAERVAQLRAAVDRLMPGKRGDKGAGCG